MIPVLNVPEIVKNEQFQVVVLPVEAISERWAYIENLLDRDPSLWDFTQTKDSIKSALLNEMCAFWMVGSDERVFFNMMTRVVTYPARRVLHVDWAMGSRFDDFIELVLEGLEIYGKGYGCSAIVIEGRDEWKRKVRPRGYSWHHSVIVKEIPVIGRMN